MGGSRSGREVEEADVEAVSRGACRGGDREETIRVGRHGLALSGSFIAAALLKIVVGPSMDERAPRSHVIVCRRLLPALRVVCRTHRRRRDLLSHVAQSVSLPSVGWRHRPAKSTKPEERERGEKERRGEGDDVAS